VYVSLVVNLLLEIKTTKKLLLIIRKIVISYKDRVQRKPGIVRELF